MTTQHASVIMNSIGRLILISLLSGFIGWLVGHNEIYPNVCLAWSAGYAAAFHAKDTLIREQILHPEVPYDKTTRIQMACDPLPEAMNSDRSWNYARCKKEMLAMGELLTATVNRTK